MEVNTKYLKENHIEIGSDGIFIVGTEWCPMPDIEIFKLINQGVFKLTEVIMDDVPSQYVTCKHVMDNYNHTCPHFDMLLFDGPSNELQLYCQRLVSEDVGPIDGNDVYLVLNAES